MKVGQKPANRRAADDPAGRAADGRPARPSRSRAGTRTRPQEPRSQRQRPQSAPTARPAERPARATSTTQAKARAKARKAKAPKAIRPPLRERLLARLAAIDISPRALLARIPFVVLVIGALAIGLGITLWLSTDSAQRSYQLGNARALNDALSQQKEALERDVLQAQSAPALADAARNLGMIPSRDTAHLVRDPAGNWVVVGAPKPAQGTPPPPLNTKLPEEKPPAPAPVQRPAPAPAPVQRPAPVLPPIAATPAGPAGPAGPEVPVPVAVPAPISPHVPAGTLPGPAPLPGPPLQGGLFTPPLGDTLAVPPAGLPAPAVPTVAAVTPVTPVAPGVIAPGGPQ